MAIKLCPHFHPFSVREGETAWLHISSAHMWDGWVAVESRRGTIYTGFEAGITWNYLEHLTRNPECLRLSGLSLDEVYDLLEKIEKEWKRKMGDK